MYCLQCGEAMPDIARFCSQCGTEINNKSVRDNTAEIENQDSGFLETETLPQAEFFETPRTASRESARVGPEKTFHERIKDKPSLRSADLHKPLLTVKPRMVTWVILARYIPMQINMTFIGALIFGGLALVYHLLTGTLEHPVRPFVFFGVFFFLLVPIIVYIAYRRTIADSYYEFYPDRVEFYEGFWTAHHKVLYYKHITEVSLRRNLIQRMYGMGTIHFAVPSRGPQYQGLFLPDLEHPVTLFDEIDSIIRAY